MATCALASGRARDGALYSTRWHLPDLLEPPSEVFYAAAKDSIPKDLSTAKGLNFMRACAILAIASIQNGQIKAMQQYAGYYHTLAAMEGLYDEKLWPKQLSPIEIEERRRLVGRALFLYLKDLLLIVCSSGRSTPLISTRLLSGAALFGIARPSLWSAIQPRSTTNTSPRRDTLLLPCQRHSPAGSVVGISRPICIASLSMPSTACDVAGRSRMA